MIFTRSCLSIFLALDIFQKETLSNEQINALAKNLVNLWTSYTRSTFEMTWSGCEVDTFFKTSLMKWSVTETVLEHLYVYYILIDVGCSKESLFARRVVIQEGLFFKDTRR